MLSLHRLYSGRLQTHASRLVATSLGLLALIWSGAGAAEAGAPEEQLQDARWQLVSMGEQNVTLPAWLEFLPENRLAGFNGCNRLMGSYSVDGESLRFSQLGSTRMACPPDIMAQANTVDEHLTGVRGFSFDEQGALVLETEQGDTRWQAADTAD